jgi:hypothetical protein
MQMNKLMLQRMGNICANSRVAARRRIGLSGLGIDWGALVQGAVGYKMEDLKRRRAEADARLLQAQQAAAAYVPTPPPAPPAAYQTAVTGTTRKLPLIPIAIGAAGLIGIGLLYFRKK